MLAQYSVIVSVNHEECSFAGVNVTKRVESFFKLNLLLTALDTIMVVYVSPWFHLDLVFRLIENTSEQVNHRLRKRWIKSLTFTWGLRLLSILMAFASLAVCFTPSCVYCFKSGKLWQEQNLLVLLSLL
jgi:hypothetical protein